MIDSYTVLITVSILRPEKEMIDSDFLAYLLISNQYKTELLISGDKAGATREALTKSQLQNFDIYYPPIPEQKRIVATLDQAFTDIEQARAKTEQNLLNARELFESYLQQVFSQRGEGWKNVSLSEICTKITDGVHKKPTYIDEGIPFLKINNLTLGSGISFENVSYISSDDHQLFCKRTHPEKGDILITKDGTIGVVRIIDTEIDFSIFVSLALIKPIDKDISPYLKFVLESPLIQDQINPQGAALKHLYLRDLRGFSIPVAPEPKQSEIVRSLNMMLIEVECLESIYQKKLDALDELKKSILQKAFTGQLTQSDNPPHNKGAAA